MLKFSANLGFLWGDSSLPEAIVASGKAGFDAVECHWPYDYEPEAVSQTLKTSRLEMIGLNTAMGTGGAADFGVSAMPGREHEARSYIDLAVAYASAINCRNIHVMSGKTGRSGTSEMVFRDNLGYACAQAAEKGIAVLIEPINLRDVPGYHLHTVEQAVETIDALGVENLKLMFDCYHVQIMQGDLSRRLKTFLPYIGHIQIAAVPDRGEPDQGEVNFRYLFEYLEDLGWQEYTGAEYKPRGGTDDGLKWLKDYRSAG